MSKHADSNTPPDVSLLLRAHAEQRWLSREVIPVLRQIETRERLPEEQLPAALAYLEMIWNEAGLRARATDAAYSLLDGRSHLEDPVLALKAARYHAGVLKLRGVVKRRVAPLIAAPADANHHVHVQH